MQEIRIPNDVYQQVTDAAKALHLSVEQYVVQAVQIQLLDDEENYDHIFTPEVIAELDRIAAEIDAGTKTYSPKEVDEYLAENRAAWLANRPR